MFYGVKISNNKQYYHTDIPKTRIYTDKSGSWHEGEVYTMFTTCSCYSERKKEKKKYWSPSFAPIQCMSSYTKNVIVTVIYTPNKHLENLNIQYYND